MQDSHSHSLTQTTTLSTSRSPFRWQVSSCQSHTLCSSLYSHFATLHSIMFNMSTSFTCHGSKISTTVWLSLTASLTVGLIWGFFGLTWIYTLTHAVVISHSSASFPNFNKLHHLQHLLQLSKQHISASVSSHPLPPTSFITWIDHFLQRFQIYC